MKILILGGTGEARALADALVQAGDQVTSSLAGRTSDPVLPQGELRVGKFGGIPGLVAYLKAGGFDALVDATHPYAALMSGNAVAASKATGVPLIRLQRPGWTEPEGAGWLRVPDFTAAAQALPSGAAVLLTTGHSELETFLARRDCRFVVRVIEPPGIPLPPNAELLRERPPFTREGELRLLRERGITHLVSKDSGGAQTAAKLEAAASLGVQVILIERPSLPGTREVGSVEEAVAALHSPSRL